MKFVVRAGEREEPVEVERVDGRYLVRVGERSYTVDRARVGAASSLLIDGRQTEVSASARGRSRYLVTTAAWSGEVDVLDPLEHLAGGPGAGEGGRSSNRVTAYMPGRVVDVLVAEGDEVERGQGVLVLEAMKMENEIQAEAEGVVRRLHVEPGQAVEAGDPLFDIE